MTPDQLTAAITNLARSVADIYSLLSDMAAQRQWSMPPFLPCGMPGYGTTLLPFQDVQPTLPQIKQRKDIAVQPMLIHQVSAVVRLQAAARGPRARQRLQEMRQKMQEAVLAAVRLQAAARGLLARRQAREMRGLQLVPVPRAPLLHHQAALRHMEGPISAAASWRSGVPLPPRVANSASTAPAFGDVGVWPPIGGP
jgi:hypothetical protein